MKTEDLLIRSCVRCKYFALCDDNFCCTKKIKILQEAPGAKFNRDIILALKINNECESYIDNGDDSLYMKDFRDFLNRN